MSKSKTCNGCKYYVSKPVLQYHGVVEGCSRTDWNNTEFKNRTCWSDSDSPKAYIKGVTK